MGSEMWCGVKNRLSCPKLQFARSVRGDSEISICAFREPRKCVVVPRSFKLSVYFIRYGSAENPIEKSFYFPYAYIFSSYTLIYIYFFTLKE